MNIFKPTFVFPLAVAGLLMGVLGGFNRLGYVGWVVPEAAAGHGLLMVAGFLGTLISLERAMVMKGKAWMLVPVFNGLSIAVVLLGLSQSGSVLLLLAGMGLVAMMYLQTVRHPLMHQYVMAFGSTFYLIGIVAWVQKGLAAAAVPWWIGFVFFTIIGERLELSKFLPTPTWAKKALLVLLMISFIGMLLPFHGHGRWLMGFAAVAVSYWLLYFDMAKIAAKKENQFRYIGIGLRVGYVWLTLHGLALCFLENHGFFYDLYLHTFFLGFAFSMIWAHAPIILPMVLNLKVSLYHPTLWIGWVLFHLSLAGRVLVSLLSWQEQRLFFGIVNGFSILAMFVLMALIVLFRTIRAKRNVVPISHPQLQTQKAFPEKNPVKTSMISSQKHETSLDVEGPPSPRIFGSKPILD
jgi:hypothetical protein